jgi:hypothetical protein
MRAARLHGGPLCVWARGNSNLGFYGIDARRACGSRNISAFADSNDAALTSGNIMTASDDCIERVRQGIQALITERVARGIFKPRQFSIQAGTGGQDIAVYFRPSQQMLEDSYDFFRAILLLLEDQPRAISVTLLNADTATGEPLQPPTGIRITAAHGFDYFPETPIDEATREMSDRLQHAVRRVLAAHGKEDPYGNGDYWIVDWISAASCKVCVWRIRFLTPSLVEQVQSLLRREFPASDVMFQLELVDEPEELPPCGIFVTKDRIQQDWDRSQLRKLFGSDFKWE